MKVLIAEDDDHIREGLRDILEDEGYQTITARDGVETLELFERESPEVCRAIRKRNETVPVIFISAKSEEIDRVLGLELGADDFIMKPFGVREVVARIRAVTRRCMAQRPDNGSEKPFTFGDMTVYPAELRARRGEEIIDLSLREVAILKLLQEHKGEVVSRDAFFDACWGLDFMPNSRTLDQHISQLRKRLEPDPKHPTLIRTVHGAGYRYEA